MLQINSELHRKMPFIITNKNVARKIESRMAYEVERDDNGVPVRNETGGFNLVSGEKIDVVVFRFICPLEFVLATKRPKQITIDNCVMYDIEKNELFGTSCHMSFQREIDQIDQAVGFCGREFKPKIWNVSSNDEKEISIWFRNDTWNYFEPHLFVITGFFHF